MLLYYEFACNAAVRLSFLPVIYTTKRDPVPAKESPHKEAYALPVTIQVPAAAAARSVNSPGTARSAIAPLTWPALVVPFRLPIPLCPLDVARAEGSIWIVFTVLVMYVVGNVSVASAVTRLSDSSVRKTSAKPGAGTLMEHVCAF